MKKLLIAVVVIVIAILGAKKLLSEKAKIANAPTPLMLNYSIATTVAKEGVVSQKRDFLAKLQSEKEVNIMTKLSGSIKALLVSESQIVKKGDLLVEIDDRTLRSKLNTLKENLKLQESDVEYVTSVYERSVKLFEAKAISKEKLDGAYLQLMGKKAQRDGSKESINALEADLEYLQIRAPFDGIVSAIYLHEGDMALFSKPILALNSKNQKMTFSFVSSVNAIKVNDTVLMEGRAIGKVEKIYPNAKNSLSVAEVTLDKPLALRGNSYHSIEVVTKTMQGCSLPQNALLHAKESTFVLAYRDNAFKKVKVDVILEDENSAIIEPCIREKVAVGSESKLSILPFYKEITLVGESDEK